MTKKIIQQNILNYIFLNCNKQKILAIYGIGHWFLNEESYLSDIDIIIFVKSNCFYIENKLNKNKREIKEYKYIKLPISIRVFNFNNVKEIFCKKSNLFINKIEREIFLKHIKFSKPLFKRLLLNDEQISNFDEYIYWKQLLKKLPDYKFLFQKNKKLYFTFHDFLKIYFFYKILKAVIYDNYPLNYSFKKIRKFYLLNKNDLIHIAYLYRYVKKHITLKEKQSFFENVLKEVNNAK